MKAHEVAKLENLMMGHLDTIDKYMLGAVLFAIFSRSRWSDLQYVHRMWVDRNEYEGQFFGFIETETSFHKTATSLKKKMRFPACCVSDPGHYRCGLDTGMVGDVCNVAGEPCKRSTC